MIPNRPTRIRHKEVKLFYTDDTPKERLERAVEICKRYGVEAELVKDWKNVNTEVSDITKVLKEGSTK